MATMISLGDITIAVTRKDIKNLHLNVHPPNGRVTISAPRHLSLNAVRSFAIGKLRWIRQQQKNLQDQERETPRDYLNRETHYVWGRRCLLTVVEANERPSVEWRHGRLTLRIRPGSEVANRAAVMDAWYREQLRAAVAALLARWQPDLGVRAERIFVQRMRTPLGELQPQGAHHSTQYGLGEEAARVSGIHSGARTDSPPGAEPWGGLHRFNEPPSSWLAPSSRVAQSIAGAA